MKKMHRIHAPDFNLEVTMDSGQVFGFLKSSAGRYTGQISGQAVALSKQGSILEVESSGKPKEAFFREYFDLERNLKPVYKIFSEDKKLSPALKTLQGLRLIKQDSWEGLVCFILSSNNNVKRIQLICRNLTEYFGSKRKVPSLYFPSPQEIAQSHEKILRQLGLGYRAPFLYFTSLYISRNPRCLDWIREAPYAEAVRRVTAFPGIGPKVADCALLYAFQKYEAFPVDVWMRRAMRKLYFRNRRVSESTVREFAQKRWGSLAGYIQQYIFHAARTGIFKF